MRAATLTKLNPLAWDRRLVAPGPVDRLRLLQGLLVLAIGCRLALRRWWSLVDRPEELFDPVPILSWMSGPPGTAAIVAVWLVGLAATAVALVSLVRRRPTGAALVVAWASLVVLAGLWGSSGKILHNDLLLITVSVPAFVAGSPRGAASPIRSGWPPRAAIAVLGTIYFLTGYQKLRHSGLEWVFSSNMTWIIRQGTPRIDVDLARWIADRQWLTQAMAGGALLLELTAPVLLAWRRTRVAFAVAATAMHTSIWLFLGLDYYGWVLAVWAVVIPMTFLGDRLLVSGGGRDRGWR